MRRGTLLLAAALLAGCASNPQPGDPRYAHNAAGDYTFTVDAMGQSYTGTARLSTATGGAVTGAYSLSGQASVTGTIAGTITGETITFDMPCTVAEAGCGGTAQGIGTVAAGGSPITGTLSLNDACAGQGSGTFRMVTR